MGIKTFTAAIVLLVLLIGLTAGIYLVQHPAIFRPKALTNSVNPSPLVPLLDLPVTDNFETDLSSWQINSSSPNAFNIITPASSIGTKDGQKVLNVYYTGAGGMWINRAFSRPVNANVSIWFYDNMDQTAGTFISLLNEAEDQIVLLGINTSLSSNEYYYRIGPNSASSGRNSSFPRSLGWHKFELVSTPVGSYGKIDGRNLSYLPNIGNVPAVNINLRNFSKIRIASTWGLATDAYYDNLVISGLPVLPSVMERQRIFMNQFVSQPMQSDFEWRAKADKAVNLAVLGRYTEVQTIINQIAQEDLAEYAATNSQFIGSQRSWGHTLTMNPLSMAAWLSWNRLDNNTKQYIATKVKQEADFWANLIDKIKATPNALSRDFQENPENVAVGYFNVPYINFISGYQNDTKSEESSWRAAFLALAANMFPGDSNARKWELAAKTFAFHTYSTGETYNGITSQTIYPNYLIANHGFLPHPQYAYGGGIDELSRGALFYLKTGKPIPDEFKHNVLNVWNAHRPYIDLQTRLFKNSRLADTYGGKDDWGADDTWYNSAYAYHDLLAGTNDLDELTKFEFYIKGDYSAFPEGGYTAGKQYNPYVKYTLDSVVAFRNASSLAFTDPSVTLTPVTVTPTPTPTPTPAPITVSSVTFNGEDLNLRGQPVTVTRLTDQDSPVDVPVIIQYASGATRSLIVRFNHNAPTPTPSPSASTDLTDTSYNMKVLVLKYFPLTANRQNIDINVTGDVGESYTEIRQRTVDVTNALKSSLERATSYLGYRDSTAQNALRYQIVDTKEYTQAVPLNSDNRKPRYNQILTDNNVCNYVQNQGVNEVWMWAYQGPNFPGSSYPYLNISESKMSGPFGDISNSYRENDMPSCGKTYRLYVFNYGRHTSEALESWGHQMEAELDAVGSNIFRNLWQGPNYPQTRGVNGRCGSVHNPPNARSEYDRNNTNQQRSDCLDWNPDSLGALTSISCQNWGCSDIDPVTNNSALNYEIWNWQNLPGRKNTKTYQGNRFRNFWDVHGDFDNVMANSRRLILPTSPTPRPTNASVVTLSGRVSGLRSGITVTINQGQNCQIGTAAANAANGTFSFNNIPSGQGFCLRAPLVPGYTGPDRSYECQTAGYKFGPPDDCGAGGGNGDRDLAADNAYNFTYTPIVTPTPTPTVTPTTTPTITPSPTPATITSAIFNGEGLNLRGQPVTATRLNYQGNPVDVPVIIQYASGVTRSLIVRFNYVPPAEPANLLTAEMQNTSITFDPTLSDPRENQKIQWFSGSDAQGAFRISGSATNGGVIQVDEWNTRDNIFIAAHPNNSTFTTQLNNNFAVILRKDSAGTASFINVSLIRP